jgi:hypothetical protein
LRCGVFPGHRTSTVAATLAYSSLQRRSDKDVGSSRGTAGRTATNGNSIYTTGCGTSLAIWYRVYRDSTTFAIKSYAIGGCVAATYGSSALQLNCPGPDLWHLAFNGAYTVIINNGTGTVLDSNGSGSAYSLPSNGGLYQQWQWIVHP